MPLMRLCGQGRFSVHGVEKREDEHIEHTTAEDITNGNVRDVRKRHGTYSGHKLREGGDGGHKHDSDPSPSKAGFFGYDVAVPGESGARVNNYRGADKKFEPKEHKTSRKEFSL